MLLESLDLCLVLDEDGLVLLHGKLINYLINYLLAKMELNDSENLWWPSHFTSPW